MVSIKNIIMENGIISATCYEEDDVEKVFFIRIDATDFSIIENSLGYVNIYCRMAIYKIRKTLQEENKLPNELLSVWV